MISRIQKKIYLGLTFLLLAQPVFANPNFTPVYQRPPVSLIITPQAVKPQPAPIIKPQPVIKPQVVNPQSTLTTKTELNLFNDDVIDSELEGDEINTESRALKLPANIIIAYTYDILGRRNSETITSNNILTTKYFIYDDREVILEQDQTFKTTTRYLRNPESRGGIGGIISAENYSDKTKTINYYTYDQQGNVTQLLNEKGAITANYKYNAFGMLIAQSGKSATINNYHFSTKEYSPLSGLSYFGARYYNPRQGRWLTPDPAGMIDGPNLYAYVGNNPINFVDPYGLQSIPGQILPPYIPMPGDNAVLFGMSRAAKLAVENNSNNDETEQVENQRSLGEIWQDFIDSLRSGISEFRRRWVKIAKDKLDPKQPNNGYSRRELWQNKETGEKIEIHRLKKNGKSPENHPHSRKPRRW
jgi:RHS repeat-associated protein